LLPEDVDHDLKYCWEIEIVKNEMKSKIAQSMLNMIQKKRSGGYEDYGSLLSKNEEALS